MKLLMHKTPKLEEERVEIYYQNMNARVQKIVDCIEEPTYLQGSLEGEKYALAVEEIYYFDTVDKVSFAYLENQVYKVQYTLGELEESLKEQGFVRISKAVIVNIYKVEYMVSEMNMRLKVHLENGEALLVSRHYKKAFEQALKGLYKKLGREEV